MFEMCTRNKKTKYYALLKFIVSLKPWTLPFWCHKNNEMKCLLGVGKMDTSLNCLCQKPEDEKKEQEKHFFHMLGI